MKTAASLLPSFVICCYQRYLILGLNLNKYLEVAFNAKIELLHAYCNKHAENVL